MATLLDPEYGAWFDPAFIHALERTSILFSLAEGDKKVLNLRVPDGG